jgi:hypothetical protein
MTARDSIRCAILGHKRLDGGLWGRGVYGQVSRTGTDPYGVSHFMISFDCARCGDTFTYARFRGNDPALQSNKEG